MLFALAFLYTGVGISSGILGWTEENWVLFLLHQWILQALQNLFFLLAFMDVASIVSLMFVCTSSSAWLFISAGCLGYPVSCWGLQVMFLCLSISPSLWLCLSGTTPPPPPQPLANGSGYSSEIMFQHLCHHVPRIIIMDWLPEIECEYLRCFLLQELSWSWCLFPGMEQWQRQ